MPIQAFLQNLPSGVTLASTAIEFGMGSRNVTVLVPSLASGTDVVFQVSHDGSTFKRLRYAPTSGTVVPTAVTIGSAVTNVYVKVNELAGQRWVKTEFTTAVADVNANLYFIVEY